MKQYKHIFFIGRFQPLHLGHVAVINKAKEISENVHILVGSSNVPRTIRNPFTFEERSQLIREVFQENPIQSITPINDHPYNDTKWITEVLTAISKAVNETTPNSKIALIGHNKDDTTYYLSLFPQYSYIEVEEAIQIDATVIRKTIFEDKIDTSQGFFKDWKYFVGPYLPRASLKFLCTFKDSIKYDYLKKEYDYVQQYKDMWASSPFPVTFVTVDSVVVQSGHILLVERGGFPGKGLLALPGGFLDQNEKMLDAAIRELREETCLKVPAPVLRGSCKSSHVFDHPLRSSRGRTITQAFYFELKNLPEGLPKVKGSDDARHAAWYPLSELQPNCMFEDHYSIIQHFTHI